MFPLSQDQTHLKYIFKWKNKTKYTWIFKKLIYKINISTSKLNLLLNEHFKPINVIVFYEF